MDLVAIKLAGWKRFRASQTIQTNGKLVAILGPNEAGKSSLLKAIRFLRSPWEAAPSDHSRDSEPSELTIIGYFSLDANERNELGISVPTRAILTKTAEGNWGTVEIQPKPQPRDGKLRKSWIEQAHRCLNNDRFREAVSEECFSKLSHLASDLSSSGPDLKPDVQESLASTISLLAQEDIPKSPGYVANLLTRLDSLGSHEAAKSPGAIAFEYVRDRVPDVLFFGAEERDLKQSYNFDELKSDVPIALQNLASIAGLDIKALIAAVDESDPAKIESIRAKANSNLKQRFEDDWSQSDVRVSFVIRDRILDILIENEPHKFTNLAERSDGFRQFVALQSFIMKERSDFPILLIDEAETHLHYDAQADLVQMLQKQRVVRKVIYSTHSAGCLPEDLGNGVRIVMPDSPQTSKIINRFWGNQSLGFDPLLIGMGASTLAFFPIRKALVVEGEAEMLLLPTMLRSALNEDGLNFQVVPGLSRANKSALPLAEASQKRVAYLVDGDAGGRALAGELRKNKVDPKSIFSLDDAPDANVSLEDVLDSKLLSTAAARLMEKFSPGAAIPKWGDLKIEKFDALASKFEAATSKSLAKIDLAYEILELVQNDFAGAVIDVSAAPKFKKLAKKICAHFREIKES